MTRSSVLFAICHTIGTTIRLPALQGPGPSPVEREDPNADHGDALAVHVKDRVHDLQWQSELGIRSSMLSF